jgi:L-malate glycosyltransferase
MTGGPRVLIVSRRFWPNCSDATQRLISWASSMVSCCASVSVLSARWHSSWSERIDVREMAVHRIELAPFNPLRSARYSRAIVEWVTKHCDEFDLIYCDAAELEAQAILSQVKNPLRPPVVVRFDPLELAMGSDARWLPSSVTLDACRRANFVIAPRADALQRLKAAGILDNKIFRIADTPSPISRTDTVRAAARNALADINHDLFVRSTDRLVVCAGELTRKWGIDLLIRAIGPLVQENRGLRVWLLGDGPERTLFYDQLRYNGWHNLIAMPGAFEDLDEILRVADLCVVPARGQGLGWLVPKCVASLIPVLAAEGAELRNIIPCEPDSPLTFRDGSADHLRDKLIRWLNEPQSIRQACVAAREQMVSQAFGGSWETVLTQCTNKPLVRSSSSYLD